MRLKLPLREKPNSTSRDGYFLQTEKKSSFTFEPLKNVLMNTSRLLKVEQARLLSSNIAFNYDDLQKRCDDYLVRIKNETQAMIETAHSESEEIKRNAYQKGFEQGKEDGLTEANRKIENESAQKAQELSELQLKTVLPAMQRAAKLVVEEKERWLVQWETRAIELCAAMAEKIIRHEIERKPEFRHEMIEAALELVSGHVSIVLTLNPIDKDLLGQCEKEIVEAIAGCGEVRIVVDENVTPGGCRISSKQGTVDATIETQLRRLSSELVQFDRFDEDQSETSSI